MLAGFSCAQRAGCLVGVSMIGRRFRCAIGVVTGVSVAVVSVVVLMRRSVAVGFVGIGDCQDCLDDMRIRLQLTF
jgi:hypothetical protein